MWSKGFGEDQVHKVIKLQAALLIVHFRVAASPLPGKILTNEGSG